MCGPEHGSDLLNWDDQEDQREALKTGAAACPNEFARRIFSVMFVQVCAYAVNFC